MLRSALRPQGRNQAERPGRAAPPAAAADGTAQGTRAIQGTQGTQGVKGAVAAMFADACEGAFEPKVQVPFIHHRGTVPRRIEVDRRRRLYESQGLAALIGVAGHTPGDFAGSADGLPLEVFDDAAFDCRSPAEWMAMARRAERPEGRFLPAEAIRRLEGGDAEVCLCRVVDWDQRRNVLFVKWGPQAVQGETAEVVPRIVVRLFAEDPIVVVQRLIHAHRRRLEATSRIKYRLCCDAMPTDGVPQIERELLDAITAVGTSAAAASDGTTKRLQAEIDTEWKRTHNYIMFERRLRSDPTLQRMVEQSTKLSVADLIPPTTRTIPDGAGTLHVVPNAEELVARSKSFSFHTYYTQPEVVKALTGVRLECMKVLQRSLFDLPKSRQMPLSTFESMQVTAIETMTKYLKETWCEAICHVIRGAFANVGKGWLNVHEGAQEVYELSKLKKLFVTVRLMMEDTLFDLVYRSLGDFTEFFEEASNFTVTVTDMNHVTNRWPGWDEEGAVEKQPLFTLGLVEKDGAFSYNTPPLLFQQTIIDLFNRAITATNVVPQVERFVMSQYFWRRDGTGPFLETVGPEEARVRNLRERLATAVRNSLEPLKEYVTTYDELLELVRLDKGDYIRRYSEEEHTTEDMREEIRRHMKARKLVAQRIPPYITVGNFVVDCQSFCYAMANKNMELARLVMDLICRIAKGKSASIREEFQRMVKTFDRTPGNAEKLYEIRNFIATIPTQVAELVLNIEDMRTYYTILEGFQYGLSDEDHHHKWEAIGWPRLLEAKLDHSQKELDRSQEDLHARMTKDIEEFGRRVDVLQRVVATFSKYTDAAAADKVSAEVKAHNIEIRKCIEEARAINNDQRLFGDELTDYRNVVDLDKEFKPFSDLWLTTHLWQSSLHKWHSDPFDSLDPEEIDTTVTTAAKTMLQLSKTFKEKVAMLKIVEDVRASVEAFKPLVPIIAALRNQGMKERHWQGLSDKLTAAKKDKVRVIPGETLVSLDDCKGLTPYKDIIISHCEVAAREYGIEKSLRDMQAKWQQRVLNIEPYKETKTFILKDSADILELLDEHLNQTQQLQFSHFKAFFAEDIDSWEHSLNFMSEVLEQWLECQKSWRYLQPIFDSEDIARQLPKLHKQFERVDRNWRKLMTNAHQNPNCLHFCTNTNKVLDIFRDCNRTLEEVQRGLNDYLQDKRQCFPRFYFLSDEGLLEILSQSRDPRRIDEHLKKLFEFMEKLEWGENNHMTGFFSSEGEQLVHVRPVVPEGNVELWLRDVEGMMKETVHSYVGQAVRSYRELPRPQWVLSWPGQVVIAVSQIFWTAECEEHLATHGNVKAYAAQLDKQLLDLVDVVQSPLNALQRINMGALITIEVHAKDTIDAMAKEGVHASSSFEWVRQLRFYFENDMCHVRQVDAHFIYGGEYLGNTGRLVVTPLTDRIYLTLTGALSLCLGGAPAGPAGTGKTETTKDLAKALAKQCVVFNCQEGMTYLSMAKVFKGLAWAGAWACFDEFNRIDVEVLSVVAQQVTDLQQACTAKQYRIVFEGSDIVVDPTYAVFITMNPGYAGRTELPDNLKVLFRPVACMVPDYALIGEIRLFSYGYKKARVLAHKMMMTFKLSSEQLSSQGHYDFGMRAVNTVISAAGMNKRESPNDAEDILLLRALRDSNIPKFLKDDIVLFDSIISDLFPGIALPESDVQVLMQALRKAVAEAKLQPVEAFLTKCVQLYDITTLRHGLMLVGASGAGKTCAYRTLQNALTGLAAMQSKGAAVGPRSYMKVFVHLCNPKSVTMDQLYGAYDDNGEWKDGVLCVLFRRAAKYGDEGNNIGKHWVMFDGPVDALWIESMNTVLDENKKLCLVSGEIIQMNRDMTMMFEVEDLAQASPATVSRCGMIFMEPQTCTPTSARVASWIATVPPYCKSVIGVLEAFAAYLDPLIHFVRKTLKEYVTTVDNNLVTSYFHILDGFLAKFAPPNPTAPMATDRAEILRQCVGPLCVFSLTWSVGGTCTDAGRPAFDAELRGAMALEHLAALPPEGVYDFHFEFSPNPEDDAAPRWVAWEALAPTLQLGGKASFGDIFVHTVDTMRQSVLLKHLTMRGVHTAVVGPTGTGKSVAVGDMLTSGLPERFVGFAIAFSAQTSATVLQSTLMSKFDKRRYNVYGAPTAKRIVVFIDDANLPQKQQFGAQAPIELLRQMIGQGAFYTFTGGIRLTNIVDVALVLAMGPPGGGRNVLSNRFMRYFTTIAFPEMSHESKTRVLTSILKEGFRLSKVSEGLYAHIAPLVKASLTIFHKCSTSFLPTPSHVHYTFNLRDVMKLFVAIYESDAAQLKDKNALVRLWVHENERVFADRLICGEDRLLFRNALDTELQTTLEYPDGYNSVVLAPRLVYGDYMSVTDRRVYEEVPNMDELTHRMKAYLDTYNEENQPGMDLVLFLDAIEHVSRIARVLRQPNGHCLLLGIGGSGRKSLTRLACSLSHQMQLVTIEITKNFGMREWHEALAKLLIGCGVHERRQTFLFSDTQILKPAFLEDVAGLLSSGDVPNLFEEKDVETINEKFKGVCLSEGLPTSKIAMYSRFIKEVRRNLHLVLAFTPIGEAFRTRMRNFPALINCCTIDWFAEWPEEALTSVARAQLNSQGIDVDGDVSEMVCGCFAAMHLTASSVTEKFFVETKRRSYVTPTSYLSHVSTFGRMLSQKQTFVKKQKSKLENGLFKLRDTEERVSELEEQLRAKQPILQQTQEDIKTMMAQLSIDREIAAEKEVAARVEEADASQKQNECAKIRRQCAERLEKAEPALLEAVKVVREIRPAALSELANYTTVSDVIRRNLEAVAILLQYGVCPKEFYTGPPGGKKVADWFLVAKSKLKSVQDLLKTLVSSEKDGGFDKERMDDALMDKIRPYYESEDCTPARARTGSFAIEALCKWMRAMYDWFYINKEVIPLRAQLAVAEQELDVVNAALAVTRAKLQEVVDNVKALQSQYDGAVARQCALESEVELTSQKLNRAARLIDGLAGEKQRWLDLVDMYGRQQHNITGDALLASSCIAYYGALTSQYRRTLKDTWRDALLNAGLTCSQPNDLITLAGDPVTIQQWQLSGLPSDTQSTENAIIMHQSGMWPLLIDPQGQANGWIRALHRDHNLQICRPSDDKYIKTIEGAIRLGFPCILENVGESLDQALWPVLLKQTYLIGSAPHIRVGDSVIPYDPNFQLFITTKLPNPRYAPETVVTVALLNFFITPTGLEDQLLGRTVERERKDLEMQKQQLTRSNAEKAVELKALQDDILRLLQEAEGDILEQEVLINTLERSKRKSTEINEDMEKAKATEAVIDEARERYRPHALRGSLLFFCVSAISVVDPMYQFSLQWFMSLFLGGIEKAERTEDVDTRVENLREYFTYSLFANVLRSLFERHKLTFTFFLCNSIISTEGSLDDDEMRFLLRGATTTGTKPNPAPEWLEERSWSEVQFASQNLPAMSEFDAHLTAHIEHYKLFFDHADAHSFPLAGDWDARRTPLQRLIVTRCLRMDKLPQGIQRYISHYLGERYIVAPQFSIMDSYKDSDCTTPLLFIVSPGSDPMSDLMKFAEQMRMTKKLDKVSLGQGQERKAEEMVVNGREKGQWVLLQNCHLASSWMPTLELLVEALSPDNTKKEFRLWLTSMPSPTFPVAVLQISVKMTNEPPLGLRANVTRTYLGMKDDELVHNAKPNDFRKLLFAISLFHAVLQERRRFGSLGFNIPYEFNDSDRAVSVMQLRKFLDTPAAIPFDVLSFLTGKINYGGRVTDDWDQRTLMTLIRDFVDAKILADGYPFSPSGTYRTVESGPRAAYLKYLGEWPINASPEIYGLHDNADITCARNDAASILGIILELQSTSVGSSSTQSRESIILKTAEELHARLQAPFPIREFQAKYPTMYNECMNTVLVQEAVRYNGLLEVMAATLKGLMQAVRGEVAMSAELDAMGNSFVLNSVPTTWAALAYPSMMPLSSWAQDLSRRLHFIQDWYDNGPPRAFWMGGFFFPQAFLTGTLQNYARKVKEAIDTIRFGFTVLNIKAGDITERPSRGTVIYGLYVEGARWDPITGCLAESRPKELYVDLPPVLLDPIVNRTPSRDVYICPVYKTLRRAGTLSTTGHSTNFVLSIELATKAPPDHWVKRGVACLIALNF